MRSWESENAPSGWYGCNQTLRLASLAAAGNLDGTLVNALLHRFGQLSQSGGESRPGIVHRIDKETSGVLIVARDDAAHQSLAAQFQSREVGKTYIALVSGSPPCSSSESLTTIVTFGSMSLFGIIANPSI